MTAAVLALLVAASPLSRALDAKLPTAARVAALEELRKTPRLDDLQTLRPLGASEDPALLGAYLRWLAAVPDPSTSEVARGLYAKTLDSRLKVLAVAAVQASADTLPFFHDVLTTELPPDTGALHVEALKKLVAVGGAPAALEALRYEARDDVTLAAQLDALYDLRAAEPAKIAAFARRHAASPNAKRILDGLRRAP